MIPLAIPRDREIVNLSQIVRVEQANLTTTAQTLTVHFSNGDIITYEGKAAEYLNTELAFALNLYRQFQMQTQSQIVTPDAAKTSRIM